MTLPTPRKTLLCLGVLLSIGCLQGTAELADSGQAADSAHPIVDSGNGDQVIADDAGEGVDAASADSGGGPTSDAWRAVAGGASHTCAVDADGQVWCWGDNSSGQLGNDTELGSSRPVRVNGVGSAVAVAAGWTHSCAVNSAGEVWCWGWNDLGTLGDGSTDERASPVKALNVSDAVGVACGDSHTCAVTADGAVWCWGLNEVGQLGDGSAPQDKVTPVRVSGLSNATSVAAGFMHTCASSADGKAWCWGTNDYGEAGPNADPDGMNPNPTPLEVTGVTGVQQVTAGDGFSCARTSGGAVWCWGENSDGQLGEGEGGASPSQIAGLGEVIDLGGGSYHLCAATYPGQVLCLGDNASGQLGVNPAEVGGGADVVTVAGLASAVNVTAGDNHTCAITRDAHELWCWGAGEDGQLGHGGDTDRFEPTKVRLP